ncbi:MAG: hypothetical protein ACRD0Z_08530 [Acidimicrobiales bacterium]
MPAPIMTALARVVSSLIVSILTALSIVHLPRPRAYPGKREGSVLGWSWDAAGNGEGARHVDDLLMSEWSDACALFEAALSSPDPDAYFDVRSRWLRVEQTVRTVLGEAGSLSLVGDESSYGRALAAGEPQLPVQLLERLAADPALLVRIGVSRNPRTPAGALATLYREGSWHVRVELADNPSCPAWMVSFLAADRSAPVRAATSQRAQLPGSILARLATDGDWRVRLAIAANKSTSALRLKELAGDHDTRVATTARRALGMALA